MNWKTRFGNGTHSSALRLPDPDFLVLSHSFQALQTHWSFNSTISFRSAGGWVKQRVNRVGFRNSPFASLFISPCYPLCGLVVVHFPERVQVDPRTKEKGGSDPYKPGRSLLLESRSCLHPGNPEKAVIVSQVMGE